MNMKWNELKNKSFWVHFGIGENNSSVLKIFLHWRLNFQRAGECLIGFRYLF